MAVAIVACHVRVRVTREKEGRCNVAWRGRDEDAGYAGENEGEWKAWRGCNYKQGGRGERGGVQRVN